MKHKLITNVGQIDLWVQNVTLGKVVVELNGN